ncbi:M16 peptidase-like protein [Aureococcus anophagefferens]|nr:M16 peptidase-like protein [Aureococcus anophagefferens]
MKLVALVGVAAALQAPRCSRTQRTKLSATRDGAQRRRLLVGGGGAVLLSPLQKALALPAAAAPRVVCDGFAVAATDDRKYRLVELASGMRVLLRSLTLKWIVPFEGEDAAAVQASRLRDRFAKPDLFLSHVLGHEGPQSLQRI